jgi:hypothetical protein
MTMRVAYRDQKKCVGNRREKSRARKKQTPRAEKSDRLLAVSFAHGKPH